METAKWNLTVPEVIVSGRSSIQQIPEMLIEAEVAQPFVVIDPGFAETPRGAAALQSIPHRAAFSSFTTNPTVEMVEAASQIFTLYPYDGIVAIGGGSAIDLTKAVGVCATGGKGIREYMRGSDITQQLPFLLAVPTTCGTGSEGVPFAVIMDPSVPAKRGFVSAKMVPRGIVLDPETLLTLDRQMIAATGIDAFAHVVESLISRKASAITRTISLGLLHSLRCSLEASWRSRELEALEHLQVVALMARMLYPRTGLSVAHALSHPLGAFTNMHHGTAVAVFLPESLRFNATVAKPLLEEASLTFGCRSFADLLDWMERFLWESGVYRSAAQLVTSKLPLATIARDAMASSNIPSNPMELDEVMVRVILDRSLTALGGA